MADENPPQLPRTQAVALEDALIAIDQRYWDILRAFQANPHGGESGNRQNPPIPKRPAALLAAFASYASALFLAEANTYPPSPNLRQWLEQLRERVSDRVSDMVDHLELQGASRGVTLGFHSVPGEELRGAVSEELNGRIEKQLNPPPPRKAPNPPLELRHGISLPLRPPLPPEVQVQLESGPYKRAGIDTESSSPLLRMALEARHLSSTEQSSKAKKKVSPLANQLRVLRDESNLTTDQIAERIGIDPRNVYRHLKGVIPRPSQMKAYEELFTETLGRKITLKRQ